ncbi:MULTISPECIES: hypothetical protein [unclassified Bradyrhizobium]|nr:MULTISPECIES: hypothetical protein [unclassified Bradyrhizobium]
MTKPTKTEAELIAMAKADPGTATRPGYPESVSMLVKIGDELSKQYDVVG